MEWLPNYTTTFSEFNVWCDYAVLKPMNAGGLCRCEDESIDELADFLGAGEAVAALTARQASEPNASCLLQYVTIYRCHLLQQCD